MPWRKEPSSDGEGSQHPATMQKYLRVVGWAWSFAAVLMRPKVALQRTQLVLVSSCGQFWEFLARVASRFLSLTAFADAFADTQTGFAAER